MHRRALLSAACGTVAVLAGCLSGTAGQLPEDDNETDTTADADGDPAETTADDDTYEQCDRTYVSVAFDLPETAQTEARGAIEEGVYESGDELLVPQLVALEQSYFVFRDDDNERFYYTMDDERENDTNRLLADQTIPETDPVHVANDGDETVTVDVSLEYAATMDRDSDVSSDGEVLLEQTLELESGAQRELRGDSDDSEGDDVDYRYGIYKATVTVDDAVTETTTWRMFEEWSTHGTITVDGETVEYVPSANYHPEGEMENCEWNDEGDLIAGPSAR